MKSRYQIISPRTVGPGDYFVDPILRGTRVVTKIDDQYVSHVDGFMGYDDLVIIKGPNSRKAGTAVLGRNLITQIEEIERNMKMGRD